MRLAILNSFPNIPVCAEKEFIARCLITLRQMGWDAAEVVTSDDILRFAPDCVLTTHECCPKLTAFPTLGVMWSPAVFFRENPERIRSILSYDGYLSASKSITSFLGDLLYSTEKQAPISNFGFFPSCYRTAFSNEAPNQRTLFYAGSGWDGARHADLFKALLGQGRMAYFGPPSAWALAGPQYRGELAVDGCAVVRRIRKCGAALCIHRREHRADNVPSMRLFEAAAAGAVIIADRLPFTLEHFGDSVLYIDVDQAPECVAFQIEQHLQWLDQNPAKAQDLARAAHAIFNRTFCLEEQFQRLPAFLDSVRSAGQFDSPTTMAAVSDDQTPMVEYIVRVGSRPAATVERCLAGLSKQTYKNLGLILVQFGPIDGFDELVAKYRGGFRSLKVLSAPPGARSTALWAGLNAVAAPFFGNCDDDDWLAPNHVATVLAAMQQRRGCSFAYSGTILVQDEPGHYSKQPNFDGPTAAVIPENRELKVLDPLDVDRLLQLDNYITSNSWIARRELLDEKLLQDPDLVVREDVLLLLAFLDKTSFAFTWRPTAQWHRRSSTQDNPTVHKHQYTADYVRRLTLRFKFSRWDAPHVERKLRIPTPESFPLPPPSPPLPATPSLALQKIEKMYFAASGVKRTLCDPKRWPKRLWTACKIIRQRGIKGVLAHSAEIGRPDIADR